MRWSLERPPDGETGRWRAGTSWSGHAPVRGTAVVVTSSSTMIGEMIGTGPSGGGAASTLKTASARSKTEGSMFRSSPYQQPTLTATGLPIGASAGTVNFSENSPDGFGGNGGTTKAAPPHCNAIIGRPPSGSGVQNASLTVATTSVPGGPWSGESETVAFAAAGGARNERMAMTAMATMATATTGLRHSLPFGPSARGRDLDEFSSTVRSAPRIGLGPNQPAARVRPVPSTATSCAHAPGSALRRRSFRKARRAWVSSLKVATGTSVVALGAEPAKSSHCCAPSEPGCSASPPSDSCVP